MIGLPSPQSDKPPRKPTADHDENGNFAVGNKAQLSPNRSKTRMTANKLFELAVSDEEVQLIARKLVEMSLDGNVKAIRILLDRKLGKIVQPIEHSTTGRVVLVLPDNGRMTSNGGSHAN